MKIWKISVDGETLGAVVDKEGKLDSDSALSLWNSQNPSYGGDTATQMRFITA